MDTKDQKKKFFYAISLGLELGFLIAIPLVLFLLLGVFLDRKLDTFPLFLISGVVLGILTTFFEIRYFVFPFVEKKGRKNNNS